jgi:signal transduction histidine kinase
MQEETLALRNLKHSLATPLTSLLCQLEMLLGEAGERDGKDQIGGNQGVNLNLLKTSELGNILTSAYQLRELIGGRDLSLTVREVFNVERELHKIVRTFDKPYRSVIELFTTGERVEVFGQRRVFMEIIHILLCNAVEAYHHLRANRQVKVVIMTLYTQTLIFICDLGGGMNWWHKLMFGVKGFSTKVIKSGLGIAKAKSDLATYFSGELKLWQSSKKSGTTVVVILPTYVENTAEEKESKSGDDKHGGGGKCKLDEQKKSGN